MKTIFAFCLFIFSSPFAMAVEDPQNILPKLDSFLAMNFSQAFHAGDRFSFTSTDCVGAEDKCDPMHVQYVVESADTQKAKVATYVGARTSPSKIADVTKAAWEQIQGNMARNVIREIESYGFFVTVSNLQASSVTVNVNGKNASFPAWELTISGKNRANMTVKQTLMLANAFGGPGQIVKRINEDRPLGGRMVTILQGFDHRD